MRDYSSTDKLAIFIIFSNIGLIFLLIFERFINGYTNKELVNVLKLLLPIQSLYFTAVLRYVLRGNKRKTRNQEPDQGRPLFSLLTKTFICVHIILLYGLIIVYGLGRYPFGLLSYGIPLVESFFGIYVGTILTDLYHAKSGKENNTFTE
jgi:hypothetical protein